MIAKSKTVVSCWGNWTFTSEREKQVLSMIRQPYCFGTNAGGSPKHPLYLKETTQLVKYGNKS